MLPDIPERSRLRCSRAVEDHTHPRPQAPRSHLQVCSHLRRDDEGWGPRGCFSGLRSSLTCLQDAISSGLSCLKASDPSPAVQMQCKALKLRLHPPSSSSEPITVCGLPYLSHLSSAALSSRRPMFIVFSHTCIQRPRHRGRVP